MQIGSLSTRSPQKPDADLPLVLERTPDVSFSSTGTDSWSLEPPPVETRLIYSDESIRFATARSVFEETDKRAFFGSDSPFVTGNGRGIRTPRTDRDVLHPTLKRPMRTPSVLMEEMDLEDFLETHGFLNYDLLSENPVLGAKTVVFDDEELGPLHLAAKLGDSEALRLLLRFGADIEALTSKKRSALDIAMSSKSASSLDSGHARVIAMLKQKGAEKKQRHGEKTGGY